MSADTSQNDYALLRHQMVDGQLRRRGVTDPKVLAAMEKMPRHLFVPAEQEVRAYDDGPLPIGMGQTISQPYMVARMTELLKLDNSSRVLEIGTGSGYQTAVLAELADHVHTMERLPELADRAKARLLKLGYSNIAFITGDGSLGHPEAAPYDAILVAAAAPRVPDALRRQLAVGGRMVIPLDAGPSQELILVERIAPDDETAASDGKQGEGFRETRVLGCVFVPLVGEEGHRP